jgi:hypothetical protein
MSRHPDRRRLTVSAVVVAAAMLIGTATASVTRYGPVTAWARQNAMPLAIVDPAAPVEVTS